MKTPLISPNTHTTDAFLQTPQLSYLGGKILKNPSFVSLYAGKFWNSSTGQDQKTALDKCSASVPSGRYSSIWNEYGVSKGSFAGSADVDLAASKQRVSERDVQGLVASAISKSQVKRPDGQTVYTVFLPPNVTLVADGADSRHGLGGFHGSYTDPNSNKRVYYAVVAYADNNNGLHITNSSVDNISIAASHEWSEAVTDPDANNGRPGWYDNNFGEVGDIPINLGYPLDRLWGRVGGCAVQKEWSNKKGKPVLS